MENYHIDAVLKTNRQEALIAIRLSFREQDHVVLDKQSLTWNGFYWEIEEAKT